MTSNQIALMNARETQRHNVQMEAETQRANSLNYENVRRGQEVQKEVAALNNSTNLAIAEANRANARYIAELDAQTKRATAEIAANNALNIASINADTSRYVSQLSSQTTMQTKSMEMNQRTFEANLKHGEFEVTQSETSRHNVVSEGNEKTRNTGSIVSSILNTVANVAKFAILPMGL